MHLHLLFYGACDYHPSFPISRPIFAFWASTSTLACLLSGPPLNPPKLTKCVLGCFLPPYAGSGVIGSVGEGNPDVVAGEDIDDQVSIEFGLSGWVLSFLIVMRGPSWTSSGEAAEPAERCEDSPVPESVMLKVASWIPNMPALLRL